MLPPVCRTQPPAPGPATRFRFPDLETVRLANGLRLFAARRCDTPLAELHLLFPAGARHQPQGEPGLASLSATLLADGTAKRSSREIAATIEQLGGYLGTGADWNLAYASTGVLAKDLETAIELLAEVVTTPTFPEEEIERHRSRRLADLRQRLQDPGALASDLLIRVLYDVGPYARPLLGTRDALAGFTQAGLRDFFATHIDAGESALVAVGDLDSDRVASLLARHLDRLPSGTAATAAAIEPRILAAVEVHLLDRPQAQQTELRLGHAGAPRNHPDRVALRLLNSILGGKFTSRINLNLRERHGFTYGAHSRFVERLGPGPFVVSTAVANPSAGAAAKEVIGELERIVVEPVSDDELKDARNYLLGVFPYLIQTLQGLATRLEEMATYGLAEDYFDRYPEALAAVTRDELLRVAREHLEPERLAVVAVGPATELRSQLAGLGPLREWTPEELSST